MDKDDLIELFIFILLKRDNFEVLLLLLLNLKIKRENYFYHEIATIMHLN